jgi:hypothetical protein
MYFDPPQIISNADLTRKLEQVDRDRKSAAARLKRAQATQERQVDPRKIVKLLTAMVGPTRQLLEAVERAEAALGSGVRGQVKTPHGEATWGEELTPEQWRGLIAGLVERITVEADGSLAVEGQLRVPADSVTLRPLPQTVEISYPHS